MKDQHEMISGYRALDEQEIDMMNQVKEYEAEGLALLDEIGSVLTDQFEALTMAEGDSSELHRLQAAEPLRWLAIGRTHLQQASMAVVRSIAQPGS